MISFKKHKLIVLVLLAGFLASVSYAFYFDIKPSVDAKAYDSIAWSLVQGTGYVETTSPIPDSAIGRLGPGYEFFLAIIYWVFGHKIWVIWIVQSLLHTASAFLVYLFIKRLYNAENSEKYAALGAGLYIFFIDLLEFPAMLLTETLYLFLVLAGTYTFFLVWNRASEKRVILMSILFSLAILVRPPATILIMLALGFLVYKKMWRYALVFSAVSIAIFTPWTVRNYLKYEKFIPTTYIIGYDVWVGNSPDAKYVGELTATKEIDDFSGKEGVFAANERGKKEVVKFLISDPIGFIKLQLIKTSIYFSAARPAAFWFHLSGISQLLTVVFSSTFAFIIFILGLSGLWRFIKKRDLVSRMMVLATLAAPVGIVWIVAETRYRYQIYPMLIVLGVIFLAEFLKSPKANLKVLTVATIVITSNTVFDVIRNLDRLMERIQKLL